MGEPCLKSFGISFLASSCLAWAICMQMQWQLKSWNPIPAQSHMNCKRVGTWHRYHGSGHNDKPPKSINTRWSCMLVSICGGDHELIVKSKIQEAHGCVRASYAAQTCAWCTVSWFRSEWHNRIFIAQFQKLRSCSVLSIYISFITENC